jgi:DNA polymerase-1
MKKLIVIDSNSVIHRAFHALPPLKDKKGEVVNAVYGYLTFLFKVLKEIEPDYIAACFDISKANFRHELYDGYKAKRQKAPQELYDQIPKVKEVLSVFNIAVFEKEGFEGDDIIGTIVKKENGNLEKIVLSGDLDNLQLIDENTKVCFLKKGVSNSEFYDKEKVEEKYEGLTPEQIIDLKALKGDSSDNIPGVMGIGEKTAINLLKEFGSLESVYENIDKVSPKVGEKLINEKEMAFISKKLGEIKTDVDIDFNIEDCKFGDFNKEEIIEVFEDYGFKSLIKRIPQKGKGDNLKLF